MPIDLIDWTPKDYPVRIPGHDLRSEGAPHRLPGCGEGSCPLNGDGRPIRSNPMTTSGGGHALCSCGATSGHLPSANQRKTWHRSHKRDVAAAQTRED